MDQELPNTGNIKWNTIHDTPFRQPEMATTPFVAIDWLVFGFFMAYITLKSGTLELAIAVMLLITSSSHCWPIMKTLH